MNALRLALVSVCCAMLVACGGSSSTTFASSPSSSEAMAARVWRSKCGACHEPVAPGSHSREAIETALRRHHKRVRLSEEQWAAMVDFLAKPQQQAKLQ